jgi:chromosome segregation ATPase
MGEESSNARTELKTVSQDNQRLFKELEIVENTFQSRKTKNFELEKELEEWRQKLEEGWKIGWEKENEMKKSLEEKENEVEGVRNEVKLVRKEVEKLAEERSRAKEELAMIRVLKTSDWALRRRCECFEGDTREEREVIMRINEVGKEWREKEESEFREADGKIAGLEEKIKELTWKIATEKTANQNRMLQNQVLVDTICDYEEVESELQSTESELLQTTSLQTELATRHSVLLEKYSKLISTLEVSKAEKDALVQKLEDVHEQLIAERLLGQQHNESLQAALENNKKLEARLKEEILTQNRVTEQLAVEKTHMASATQQIKPVIDIDTVLHNLLAQLGMPGIISKGEKGYVYNGNCICLEMGKDHNIVICSKNGSVGLTEFLMNGRKVERRSENRPEVSDKTKSPMRSLISPVGHGGKTGKTPLRDRNGSLTVKKRVFK